MEGDDSLVVSDLVDVRVITGSCAAPFTFVFCCGFTSFHHCSKMLFLGA